LLEYGFKHFPAEVVQAVADVRGLHQEVSTFAIALAHNITEWSIWDEILAFREVYRVRELRHIASADLVKIILQLGNFPMRAAALGALVVRGEFGEVAKAPENLRRALSRLLSLQPELRKACAKAWLAGNIDFLRQAIVFSDVRRRFNLENELIVKLLKHSEVGIVKAWPIERRLLPLHVTDAEWAQAKEDPERAKYLREVLPADVKADFGLE
jgi:hypothetical protein